MNKKMYLLFFVLGFFGLQHAADLVTPGANDYIKSLYSDYQREYQKAVRLQDEEVRALNRGSYGGALMHRTTVTFPSVDSYVKDALSVFNRTRLDAMLEWAKKNRDTLLEEAVSDICNKIDQQAKNIFWSKVGDAYSDISGRLRELKQTKPNELPLLYNSKNSNGDTLLMAIARAGQTIIFNDLLWKWENEERLRNPNIKEHLGVRHSLNLKNNEGNTVLMLASLLDKDGIISTLVNPLLKVDLGMKNQQGKTAFELALNKGNLNSLTVFLKSDYFKLLKESPLLYDVFLLACSQGKKNTERADFIFNTLLDTKVVQQTLEQYGYDKTKGYDVFLNVCQDGSENMFNRLFNMKGVAEYHAANGHEAVLRAIEGHRSNFAEILLNIDAIKKSLDSDNGKGWCALFVRACNQQIFTAAKLSLPHVPHACVMQQIDNIASYPDSHAARDILGVYRLQEPVIKESDFAEVSMLWEAYEPFKKSGDAEKLREILFDFPYKMRKKTDSTVWIDRMHQAVCKIIPPRSVPLLMECIVQSDLEKSMANGYIHACRIEGQKPAYIQL
ncbi:ankyrin repeat domain-containing protein, partial [Candidatus Babeliales bacterium]|nr:ankyrin repeat domain-containing protein [Candidatus Babeliales bacterium]